MRQVLLAGAFAWPFFALGAFVAALYRQVRSPTVAYATDVTGAAVGALLGLWLLRTQGDVVTGLVALQALALAGVWLYPRLAAWPLLLAPLLLVAHLLAPQWLELDPFDASTWRPHLVEQTQPHAGHLVATRTDGYARTDLVQTDEQWLRYLYTDRMYAARVVRWDGQSPLFPDDAPQRLTRLKRLPFAHLHPKDVLILGAGGGLDVVLALQAGAAHVDAVEINAAMVAFTRQLGDFAGHVYERPDVTVHIDEARRFVRHTPARYDLVQMSLMQTDSAALHTSAGVQSWVMTVDAVIAYLRVVSPDGMLVIVQNTAEIADRTVATLRAALATDDQVRVLALPEAEKNPFGFVLCVRPRPFTPAETDALTHDAQVVGAIRRPLAPTSPAHPPTDAHPWFYALHPALVGVQVLLLLAAFAVARVLLAGRRSPLVRRTWWIAWLLGLGAMAAQSVLLATGQFLLGSPPEAVAMVLVAGLLAAAVGALVGPRLMPDPRRRLWLAAWGAASALAILGAAWSALLHASWLVAAHADVALLVGLTTAIGLPLGVVFPALLAHFGGEAGDLRAALYATDGLGAVAGGALALVVSALAGEPAVAGAAAAALACVGWLAREDG